MIPRFQIGAGQAVIPSLMETLAFIPLLLLAIEPTASSAKDTGPIPNASSGSHTVPILTPDLSQIEKKLLAQNLAQKQVTTSTVNVSASVTTNSDEDEKGHLAWTLAGVQTTPAWMVDPYRIINGHTNIVGAGWMLFTGRIIGGGADGILLDGTLNTVPKSENPYVGEFLVANYPYNCDVNGTIGSAIQWFYARPAGSFSYTNDTLGFLAVPRLDYGQPWVVPPPTPEQLAARQKLVDAANAAAAAKKKEMLDHILQSDEESAARGEPYGLRRMGERYRDGVGVERDLAKARDYLQRATDVGSAFAKADLEALK